MPRGNGTGPMGLGPMTGRGAGYCAGYGIPGCMHPVDGRGFGLGRGAGFGRGFGRSWNGAGAARPVYPQAVWGSATAEQEQAALKSQLANLEQLSADLRQRLTDLENAEATKK